MRGETKQFRGRAEKDLCFDCESLIVINHGERIQNARDMIAATENIPGIVR
jgi:hypothetical protein